jgi:hypothetical protein
MPVRSRQRSYQCKWNAIITYLSASIRSWHVCVIWRCHFLRISHYFWSLVHVIAVRSQTLRKVKLNPRDSLYLAQLTISLSANSPVTGLRNGEVTYKNISHIQSAVLIGTLSQCYKFVRFNLTIIFVFR